MKIVKNKIAAMTIVILFITSMIPSLTLTPSVNAHTPPWSFPTYSFISVNPNPCGIGQQVSVNFWEDITPLTAVNQFGDKLTGYTLTVTKPDGTTETLGPFTSDDTGGSHTYYTPTELGNYTFVFHFPAQTVIGANPSPVFGTINQQYVNDTYLASDSVPYTLTVQQAPINMIPTAPLPTSYWTRPIEAQNINWYTISGDWIMTGYNATDRFNPYTTGPTTGHIMWTKPYSAGGLIGGTYGGGTTNSNYDSTNQYQNKIAPIIMDGVLYYTLYPGATGSPEGWVAVNLNTGATLWTKNTADVLLTGQIMQFTSPNQRGGRPYLWANPLLTVNGVIVGNPNTAGQQVNSSVLEMFDAMTGNWICNVVGVPGGTYLTQDSIGSVILYYINATTSQGAYGPETLNMWNSTLAIQQYGVATNENVNFWSWQPPQGANIPFAYGIQWTVPLTTTMTYNGATVNINMAMQVANGLLGASPNNGGTPSSYPLAITKVADVILVDDSAAGSRFSFPGWWISEGYDPNTGAPVWGPTNNTQLPPWTRAAVGAIGDGVYTMVDYASQSDWGYSLATGALLWGPTSWAVANNPWGYYTYIAYIAYGTLYQADFGGNVFAINCTTGAIEWCFSLGSAGAQTPYGVWPITNFQCIADGKLYVSGGHLYSPPIYAGATIDCLNATSGALIWTMPDFAISNGAAGAISDGYLVVPNAYDNQLYAYGMGPSKTTVTAPNVGVTTATPITISGTVTDIASGSQQQAVAANFPNGLPAVSDASMTQWMEYVYEQQPMPNNATGVSVTINVVDSNGNYRTIGTTTSNIYGTYSLAWTPDIPGNYTVIANFAGTQSYYPSSAATAFIASASPATPAPTAVLQQNQVTMPDFILSMAVGVIAIIIAIAIVGLLLMRKKP